MKKFIRYFEKWLDLIIVMIAIRCALGIANPSNANLAYWLSGMAALDGVKKKVLVGDSRGKDPLWYDLTIRVIQAVLFAYGGWWWCSAAWTVNLIGFQVATDRWAKRSASSTGE